MRGKDITALIKRNNLQICKVWKDLGITAQRLMHYRNLDEVPKFEARAFNDYFNEVAINHKPSKTRKS